MAPSASNTTQADILSRVSDNKVQSQIEGLIESGADPETVRKALGIVTKAPSGSTKRLGTIAKRAIRNAKSSSASTSSPAETRSVKSTREAQQAREQRLVNAASFQWQNPSEKHAATLRAFELDPRGDRGAFVRRLERHGTTVAPLRRGRKSVVSLMTDTHV